MTAGTSMHRYSASVPNPVAGARSGRWWRLEWFWRGRREQWFPRSRPDGYDRAKSGRV